MKNSRDVLSSILKDTQMGQVGIRSVLDTTICPALRQALESQLREYDGIEGDAHRIACQRGWELPELDPAVRFFSDRITRIKLPRGNCDSKIAAMMIQGNTKSMIRQLQTIHQLQKEDHQINTLSQKLLDCETANIRQMQRFL